MAIILTGSTGVATPAVVDASGGNTATINSMTPTADSLQGFRNRLINSDMRIDQRNAGASVTHSGSANLYVLDRWVCNSTGTPQFSVQRVADAPAGFINSSKLTTTTSGTPSASDFSYYGQYIEGFSVADLGFGTASAKTVTISFWVKSSLTGTFGGALKNGAVNRAYPFSYTISSANTWEQKSVTITGDTTGTWTTDNTIGMGVFFDTGSGSNNKGTAGAWNATANIGVTGGVNLVATASATWYITGVQLEVGSVATPFERRDYGRELIMCQRYCYVLTGTGGYRPFGQGWNHATTIGRTGINLPVTMRASPSGSFSAANTFLWQSAGANFSVTAMTETLSSTSLYLCDATVSGATGGYSGVLLDNASTSAKITLAAEL